jgi:uncharacterized protein YkwD
MKWVLLCICLGALLFCKPAGEGIRTCAGEGEKFKQTDDERKIFELTNAERKKKDLPALKLNPLLCKVARAHSANMARQGKVEHELDGKTPFDRIKAAGYEYMDAGENVAKGEEGAMPVKVMMRWMDSKGHRENILDRDFAEIGIGIAIAKDGQLYYTQVFGTPLKE